MRRKPKTAVRSKTLARRSLFGPPPVLKNENAEAFERLIKQLYADLAPQDLAEESFIHVIAHAEWDIRRWRRIKTCLLEGALPNAMIWTFNNPYCERLRYLRGAEEIDLESYPGKPQSQDYNPER